MQRSKSIRWLLAVVFFAAMGNTVVYLAGCGGGGGDDGGSGDDGDSSYVSFGALDISFGEVVITHFADQTLSLKNVGTIALPLGQIDSPDTPFSIEDDQCSGKTLAPSGTCGIQVRFSPASRGEYSDNFVVPLSGSDTAYATVNLEGGGRLYNVSINQLRTDICPTITLIVSVTNVKDDFVTGLEQEDFVVVENGGELDQSTSDVEQGASSNLSVVLALDNSGSVGNVIEDIIAAAKEFIGDMNAADEAAIFKFAGSGAELIQAFTLATDPEGKEILTSAIDSEDMTGSVGGNTALYEAVADISEYIIANATDGNRLAIIIITDGEDTASEIDLDEAIAIALDAGTPVFTIGSGAENADVLQELANDTGGQYYDAPQAEDLSEIYLKTSELLSNQYEIEYTSTLEDVAVSLDLEVVDGDVLLGSDSREFEGCPAAGN